MTSAQEVIDNEVERTLEYEKDPSFIEFMKMRLDSAIKDREAGRLVEADAAFMDIRNRYGW